jgi:S1-C subfamily serine protease
VRADNGLGRYAYVSSERVSDRRTPIFHTEVNIFSIFHSNNAKYLAINLGSSGYGNVSVIFKNDNDNHKMYVSEMQYRSIIDAALIQDQPDLNNWTLYRLIAPIRTFNENEAYVRASALYTKQNNNDEWENKNSATIDLAINMENLTTRKIAPNEMAKFWHRGLPDSSASYSSGFFVSSKHILTNAHSVKNAKSVYVGQGNKETSAIILAKSNEYDLAILEIPDNSLNGKPISLADAFPELGEKIRSYGYPLPNIQGYTLKITEGNIIGKYGLNDNPLHFQCSCPIQPGSSGCALLNSQNNLIGVAYASLDKLELIRKTGYISENVNIGVHLDVVRKFLDSNKIVIGREKEQSFNPYLSCVQVIANYD